MEEAKELEVAVRNLEEIKTVSFVDRQATPKIQMSNKQGSQPEQTHALNATANSNNLAMMHQDDDDDFFGDQGFNGLHEEPAEDTNKKFLFARQLTHFFEDNPPLPLLPKSMVRANESPRTGGQNFLKLTRFRGQDFGKSKFNKEQEVERVNFPREITTLKQIFQPLPPAQ